MTGKFINRLHQSHHFDDKIMITLKFSDEEDIYVSDASG